jgi:hypothetical protein
MLAAISLIASSHCGLERHNADEANIDASGLSADKANR